MLGINSRLRSHVLAIVTLAIVGAGSANAEMLYITSFNTDRILGYDTAGYYQTFPNDPVVTYGADSPLDQPTGVERGPDGNLYVSSFGTNQILKFDGQTGNYLGVFANTATHPMDTAFRPDGYLYVVENTNSGGGNFVARFDATTGAFVDQLPGFLQSAQGIAFDSSDRLYVSDFNNRSVERFNSVSGGYETFIPSSIVNLPTGLAFTANGHLLVGNFGYDRIDEFDADGLFLGSFGTTRAYGVAFSPNGQLYVGDGGTSSISQFDPQNGNSQSIFVGAFIGGLTAPGFMTFQPDIATAAPEPSMFVLALSGLPGGLGMFFWRRGSRVPC